MGVCGQRHVPAALPPGKTRHPLYRWLGGLQGWSGQVRKNPPPPPPGFDPRTVQPVASRYTDWAIPAHGRKHYYYYYYYYYYYFSFYNVWVHSGSPSLIHTFVIVCTFNFELSHHLHLILSKQLPKFPAQEKQWVFITNTNRLKMLWKTITKNCEITQNT